MQEHARAAIEAAKGATLDRRILDAFLSRLSYVGGDAQDDELYEPLRSALKGSKLPVFYLAIPPASFLDDIASTSLTRGSSRTLALWWRSRSGRISSPRAS